MALVPGMKLKYDDELDTGMKVAEAVRQAERWWDRIGRGLVPRQLNKSDNTRASHSAGGPIIRVVDIVDELPDGILRGLQWRDLTREEQLKIVKHWHHNFVRLPLSRRMSKLS